MKNFLIYLMIIINICFLFWSSTYKIEKINEKPIYIEVKGAVKAPGVYKVFENAIVSDVIKLSGGLLSNADVSILNLGRKLTDEMVVIVYTKKEIEEMRKGTTSVKYIDKECVCPIIPRYPCLEDIVTNLDGVINMTGKISLNSATLEEIMTLPGIGATKAQAIIDYRKDNKGFRTIDEIMKVKGIGASTYEKIKYYLTL